MLPKDKPQAYLKPTPPRPGPVSGLGSLPVSELPHIRAGPVGSDSESVTESRSEAASDTNVRQAGPEGAPLEAAGTLPRLLHQASREA